ncbi:MAG: RHS repeat domain-containing protein, partial [Acidimicrobiales bacterium]
GTPGTGANPYNHTYAYTHDGNIDSRTEGPTTIDYTYPAGGLSSTRPHAPTEVGSDDYAWDASGNLDTRTIAGEAEDLTWDPEHRLAAVGDPDGDTGFVYDADGARLLRQTADGTTLYIEGHEITAPTSGPTTAVRSYTFAGNLIATRDPGGVDYLATDNQGSVELSVPAGATTPETTRTYYPYGDQRTGSQLNSDRAWIGQIEDDTTGLQYLNNRYYDPTTGIFTAPDPVYDKGRPQTHNPYNYSASNPTTLSDPSGLDPPCFHPGVSCSPAIAQAQLRSSAPNWVQTPPNGDEGLDLPEFDFSNDECADSCADFDAMILELSVECMENIGFFDTLADCFPEAIERDLVQQFEEEASDALRQMEALVPPEWGPGEPTRKGDGRRWTDPDDPGNGVRIDPANPTSPQISQRVDHVVVRHNGQVIGRNGQPIQGSIAENALEAHIPLREWLTWSRWYAP